MAKWEQAPVIEENRQRSKWMSAPPVSEPSQKAVRTLQRPSAPLKDISVERENLGLRGLKQAINIIPNIGRKIFGSKSIPNKLVIKGMSKILSKTEPFKGIPSKDIEKDMKADFDKVSNKIPALTIDPPEGLGEKVVDIGANVAQFVTELAILKKAAPAGTSEAAIWEMQNLISGGTPGTGATMAGVFSVPLLTS